MNRRSFIRSLMAGIAGVVGAPLMRRSEVKASVVRMGSSWVEGEEKTFVLREWSLESHGYFIDVDKIRFVRGEPQTVYGWERL